MLGDEVPGREVARPGVSVRVTGCLFGVAEGLVAEVVEGNVHASHEA